MNDEITELWDTTKSHVVWTLSYAGWDTDGVPRTEREAVKLAAEHRLLGAKAIALQIGKEPEYLHPADKPIFTI